MAIDDAVLIPPIAAEEIAEDAALIDRRPIRIVEAVESGNAGEPGRPLDRHPPLQPAEPLDDVVEILLLVAIEETEFTAGFAAAARIHLRIDIAALDIEADRTGLAPQKLRRRRQRIVVVAIGRGAEHDRKRTFAVRHVKRERDLDAVMDADHDFAALWLVRHYGFPQLATK